MTYTCNFCKTVIDWEGTNEYRGKIWECEECGNMFCEACLIEKCGKKAFEESLTMEGEEKVLCPDCYKKIHYEERTHQNTMKDIIEHQKEREAWDKFNGEE